MHQPTHSLMQKRAWLRAMATYAVCVWGGSYSVTGEKLGILGKCFRQWELPGDGSEWNYLLPVLSSALFLFYGFQK